MQGVFLKMLKIFTFFYLSYCKYVDFTIEFVENI